MCASCSYFIFASSCNPMLSNLFDTAGHLVNFPPAGGPQSRGGPWRARGARAYKGAWGRSLQRGSGAEPLVGRSGGRSPLKLKHFLLPNVQWKPQIRPFFWNLETKTTIYVGQWRATWNPLAGRMRPAGRGLDSTALSQYSEPKTLTVSKANLVSYSRQDWKLSVSYCTQRGLYGL